MQNNYQGPPQDFAMVVPVPVVLHEGDVKTLPKEVFAKVDMMGAPRLVEYWEQDPCEPERPQVLYDMAPSAAMRCGREHGREVEGLRRQDRGAVRRRRVPDRDPVGEGFDRPRVVAAR